MNPEFWHKQVPGKPLFPELEWSRPENRMMAGKLLIVGGNLYGFAAPAEAYAESVGAGIGTSRVLLPSAIQKVVGPSIENGEFAASTPSGSFSQRALVELLDWCKWADGILFAGDLGRNSETAIMQEKFLQKCEALTVLTKDAVDYVVASPLSALERPNTVLVLSLSQLQRLGISAKFEMPITFGMNLVQLLEWLHVFTSRFACHIVVKHLDNIFVGVNGEVSTTKVSPELKVWRLKTASHIAVWWVQNHTKTFEALTTAVHEIAKSK
jgi:hypothetical protein